MAAAAQLPASLTPGMADVFAAAIGELAERPSDDWERLFVGAATQNEVAGLESQNVQLTAEVARSRAERDACLQGVETRFGLPVADLARSNSDLQAQIQILQEQVEQCGVPGDLPPCWPVTEGPRRNRPEYAFEVTIEEQSLDVRAIWPEHRQNDARQIPGMNLLSGSYAELDEFRRKALPILDWSDQHTPRCRHYVQIVDEAESKDAFKSRLLTIEDYFYKYLPRTTS